MENVEPKSAKNRVTFEVEFVSIWCVSVVFCKGDYACLQQKLPLRSYPNYKDSPSHKLD